MTDQPTATKADEFELEPTFKQEVLTTGFHGTTTKRTRVLITVTSHARASMFLSLWSEIGKFSTCQLTAELRKRTDGNTAVYLFTDFDGTPDEIMSNILVWMAYGITNRV